MECDFLIAEKEEVQTALQVSLSLADPDTREREIRGLIAACKRFGLSNGLIISREDNEEFQREGITVTVVPAYKYFLEKELEK